MCGGDLSIFSVWTYEVVAERVAPVGAQDSGQTVWECVYVCVIV